MDNLREKTLEELQGIYLAEVGRPTRAQNRDFLIWKIREHRRGGPRAPSQRKSDPKRRVNLHIPEELGQLVETAAQAEGKSLTAFICDALRAAV